MNYQTLHRLAPPGTKDEHRADLGPNRKASSSTLRERFLAFVVMAVVMIAAFTATFAVQAFIGEPTSAATAVALYAIGVVLLAVAVIAPKMVLDVAKHLRAEFDGIVETTKQFLQPNATLAFSGASHSTYSLIESGGSSREQFGGGIDGGTGGITKKAITHGDFMTADDGSSWGAPLHRTDGFSEFQTTTHGADGTTDHRRQELVTT